MKSKKNHDYIKYSGFSYFVNIPIKLRSKYKLDSKYFKKYEDAKKFRDEVRPYYTKKSYKFIPKNFFKTSKIIGDNGSIIENITQRIYPLFIVTAS